MLNGTYFNPTVFHFGSGAASHVGPETRKYGARILLVYGGGSVKTNGAYADVVESLRQADVEIHELAGVVPNPRAEPIREGIALCRRHAIEFILGVGGGSVIDSAKAIAAGVPYDGDFYDFYCGKAKPASVLKVGAVVTVPGAGSESGCSSVISRDGEKRVCDDPALYPAFAILDPRYTVTVPAFETACGIVDAMSHIFERYFSNTDHVDCTDRICEGLLLSLIDSAHRIRNDPADYGVRSEIMWACKLAHDQTPGFGRKQDWGCHKIGHEIGARIDAAHGAVMGVVFLAWFKFAALQNGHKLAQLGQRVFGAGGMAPEHAAALAIERFEQFLVDIGMPTSLAELGVETESFQGIAAGAVRAMQSGTIGNYVRLSPENIVALLQTAHG